MRMFIMNARRDGDQYILVRAQNREDAICHWQQYNETAKKPTTVLEVPNLIGAAGVILWRELVSPAN